MERPSVDDYFGDWKQREALVQEMIPVIGRLFSQRNVGIFIYGRPLHNRSVTFIMKSHRFVRQVERNEMSEFETHLTLMAMAKLDLWHAQIDLGKLTVRYMEHRDSQRDSALSVDDFVRSEMGYLDGLKKKPIEKSQDVVLYGFGRIGRLMARLLVERTSTGEVMRLRAIVVRPGGPGDLEKRANLFTSDSVHGAFQGTLRVDEENCSLIANGNVIKVIYANSPEEIDYREHDIDDALIIDNTGKWRDEEGLSLHLKSKGASKVILTAPGKGALKTIVYGINDHQMSADDKIITAASCTTNAIAPVLKVVNDRFGIEHGHVETVHAYTNDQRLADVPHSDCRRSRAAAENVIPTTTGAARAVGVVLPELNGKLDGIAMRVPVPDGSVVDFNVQLNKDVTVDQINEAVREASINGSLKGILEYSTLPVVSSDIIGNSHSSIFDAPFTRVIGGNYVKTLNWYDNEWGYSNRVVDLVSLLGSIG